MCAGFNIAVRFRVFSGGERVARARPAAAIGFRQPLDSSFAGTSEETATTAELAQPASASLPKDRRSFGGSLPRDRGHAQAVSNGRAPFGEPSLFQPASWHLPPNHRQPWLQWVTNRGSETESNEQTKQRMQLTQEQVREQLRLQTQAAQAVAAAEAAELAKLLSPASETQQTQTQASTAPQTADSASGVHGAASATIVATDAAATQASAAAPSTQQTPQPSPDRPDQHQRHPLSAQDTQSPSLPQQPANQQTAQPPETIESAWVTARRHRARAHQMAQAPQPPPEMQLYGPAGAVDEKDTEITTKTVWIAQSKAAQNENAFQQVCCCADCV